jgi:hypothetical protein
MAETFFWALEPVYAVPYSFLRIVDTDPMTWWWLVEESCIGQRALYVVNVAIGEEASTTSHHRPESLPASLGDFGEGVYVLHILLGTSTLHIRARVDLSGISRGLLISTEHHAE